MERGGFLGVTAGAAILSILIAGCGGAAAKGNDGGTGGLSAASGGNGGGGQTGTGGTRGAGGAVAGCGASEIAYIKNGSFECPRVPAGSYLTFHSGETFPGWTVVGGGDVSPISTTFASNGFDFPAQDGIQAIDLTGPSSNGAEGVSQTVPTIPRDEYHLSFWIGNVVDNTSGYGTTSTVDVLIDGEKMLTARNSGAIGSTTIFWQQFFVVFTATLDMTTIAFINADPATDNSNFLDHVELSGILE